MRQLILCDDGDVDAVAPLCRRAGLGIEAQAFYAAYQIDQDPTAIAKHREALANLPLVALHGPFPDLCPGSADPMVREVARNRFEFGYRVARELGSPDVDVCLDIGHARCNSRVPVVDWIEALGDQIGYVHLHDNHGTDDEHLGLGEGTIPLVEVFSALERRAPHAIWALEAKVDGLETSLEWLGSRSLGRSV